MLFSQNLKYIRELNHVTQKELANHLNVSRSTITGYEVRGKQPDYEKLIRIAAYFQVSVDYLLRGPSDEKDLLCAGTSNAQKGTALLRRYQKLSEDSQRKTFEYMELLSLKDQRDARKKKK